MDRHLFYFSEYPESSTFYDLAYKKIPGKMKNEFKGKIIYEFIGLKCKMYSLISVDDKEVRKAKGVN